MPSHTNPLVCNSVTLHPNQRATVTVRPQEVYRPDAVRVVAMGRGVAGSPDVMTDVGWQVRVHDVEWQLGSYDPAKCASADDRARTEAMIREGRIRLGREKIDQLGPLVTLEGIPNRTLIVAQDIACTVESEWPEPVLVTVQFEGCGVW